jgi:hypothetical protein
MPLPDKELIMSNKVFADSANIYEDQARVLFKYFGQKAEQIVREEEDLEKNIAIAREEVAQHNNQQESKEGQVKISWICAGVAAVVGIATAIVGSHVLGIGIVLAAAGGGIYGYLCKREAARFSDMREASLSQISVFEQAFREIRRDYKVHKLGVGYVPLAGRVPFEGRSFLIDYTGTEETKDFRLSSVKKKDLFTGAIQGLEEMLHSIPAVEGSSDIEEVETDQYSRSIQKIPYYDYFGGLDRKLRTITHCLSDLEVSSVQIPVIFPGSDYAKFIEEHATTVPEGATVFRLFDQTRYDESLDKFQSLNQMKKSLERNSRQFEQVLRSVMVNTAQTVQAITELKVKSTDALIEQSNRLFYTVLKASYNHYSPRLEAEEIDRISQESFDYQDSVDSYQPFHLKASSRVLYDAISENWVAEDGSRTSCPFGMNQIQEEILAPIVESLMRETRLERLKVYHSIQDQKNDYLNKWHQDTEDFYGRNRAESADLINLMRSSFTEFIANYNTLQALEQTDEQMGQTGDESSGVIRAKDTGAESMASYEMQRHQFQGVQDDFLAYMERLKDEINHRADKFRFIEYYDASLRDEQARAMSRAGQNMQAVDARRKPLLAVNALYAECSDLAPAPFMEDLAETHYSLDLNSIASDAIHKLESMGE